MRLYISPRRPSLVMVFAESDDEARMKVDAQYRRQGSPPLNDVESLVAVAIDPNCTVVLT